jgi:hypothetical protein
VVNTRTRFNAQTSAQRAFERYTALRKREVADPALTDDPAHLAAVVIEHARFRLAMEASGAD